LIAIVSALGQAREPEASVRFPVVAPSVAAKSTSPHGVVIPSSVFVSSRGSGSCGSPLSATTLALTSLVLAGFPATAALRHLFKRHCHPLLGFHSPPGYCRRTTVALRAHSRVGSLNQHDSSPGVLFPTAIASEKGPLHPGLPRPGTLRLQSFYSPDAFLPFAPSARFWAGRSWDSPFRALLLSKVQGLFRVLPSPPGVALPSGTTLAVSAPGPVIVEVHDASRADR
jgi:hypothetical protein